MATRQLRVEIVGDSASLEKALGRSSAATGRWGGAVQKAGRYAGFAGLAIGGALTAGLVKATKGAIEDEAAQARLAQAFKQSNVPIQNYSKAIDQAEAAGVRLGFADDAVVESLGSLVVATHDGKKAIDLLSVAEDIARFKHIDLAGASKMLTMAMAGSQRATKQLGLSLQPTTENVDALKKAAEESKTKVDSMALAQAKAADKMQTSQNVIALVTQKLKGQSQAFSETAAGGIERMKASLDRLSDTIGAALLPALTKVIDPLSKFFAYLAENPKLAEGLVIGIAALAAALLALSVAASAAASIGTLAAVFAAVSLPIAAAVVALVALGAAIAAAALWPDKLQKALERMGMSTKDAKATVEALQNAFTAIKAVVQTVWPAVEAIVVPALKVISGLLMIVSGILRGDFSQAWKGMKQVVAGQVQLVVALLTAFPRVIFNVALAIGKALIDGIKSGATSAWSGFATWISSLPAKIKGYFAGAGTWLLQAGKDIIAGLWSGVASLWPSFIGWLKSLVPDIPGVFRKFLGIGSPSKVFHEIGVDVIDGLIQGLNAKDFKQPMVDKINEALDAAQQAVTDRQGVFASAFDSLLNEALSAFDRLTAEFETRTERKIRTEDERRAAADRQRRYNEALAAQQALMASGEASNADLLAAQRAVADAAFEIQRAADEKRANKERQEYEAKRERQRVALENQLLALQQNYLQQELTTQQFHERMIKIFKKFEVPLGKAANQLGAALAQGLNDSFKAVQDAARALANEILTQFSKIRVIINVDLSVKNSEPPKRQYGGPVTRNMPYIVGEAGPELFIPTTSGRIVANGQATMRAAGGQTVIALNFYGPAVGTDRQFQDLVRRALYDVSKRNPGTGLATT